MSELFSIFHLFLRENDIVSCCCILAFTQFCLLSRGCKHDWVDGSHNYYCESFRKLFAYAVLSALDVCDLWLVRKQTTVHHAAKDICRLITVRWVR